MTSPISIPLFPPKFDPKVFLRSSTSTVCVESTISNPSDAQLVKGLSKFIWSLLFNCSQFVCTIGQKFPPSNEGLGDFQVLSKELILKILSNLDQVALCEMNKVSKSFYGLSSSDELWKPIYLQRFGTCELRPTMKDKRFYSWKGLFVLEIFRTDLSIYDELKNPIGPFDSIEEIEELPTESTIQQFITFLYDQTPTSYGSLIFAAVYLRRLHEVAKIWILPFNWRRIVITILMLGAKVWEEDAVWLDDFISVFPTVPIKQMNLMEKIILALLDFGVGVKPKDYAMGYFDLRVQTDPKEGMKPIDSEIQARLEIVNKRSEEMFSKKNKSKQLFSMTKSEDRGSYNMKKKSRFVID